MDKRKWVPHIRRDWAIIICSFIVIFFVFVTLHSFFYLTLFSSNFFLREDTSVSSVPDRVQQKKMNGVITFYQKKKETFDSIIKNPVPFADPSRALGAIEPTSPLATSTENVDPVRETIVR